MDSDRREQLRRSLRGLAESQAATVDFLQVAFQLIEEEFSLDPVTYFRRTISPPVSEVSTSQLQIERTLLSVSFGGKTCFLGNTYPFKMLLHLAENRNKYVSREELFEVVWEGERSEEALRSTVKVLRKRLRGAGLIELADAIDGSAKGHYVLKLTT